MPKSFSGPPLSLAKPLSGPPSSGWTKESIELERSLIEAHVEAIEGRIKGDVRNWLEADSSDSVSSDVWIDAAFNLMLSGFSPEQIEKESKEMYAARDQVKESLRQEIAKGKSPFKVSDEDVETSARRIARAIVSNWLSLVNRGYWRAFEADRNLTLGSTWLPEGVSDADLGLGLTKYGADPDKVLAALRDYLDKLASTNRKFGINAAFSIQIDGGVRTIVVNNPVEELATSPAKINEDALENKVVSWVLKVPSIETETQPEISRELQVRANVRAGVLAAAKVARLEAADMPLPSGNQLKGTDALFDLIAKLAEESFPSVEEQAESGRPSSGAGSSSMTRTKAAQLRQQARDEMRKLAAMSLRKPEAVVSDAEVDDFRQTCEVLKAGYVYSFAADNDLFELVDAHARARLKDFSFSAKGSSYVPNDQVVDWATGLLMEFKQRTTLVAQPRLHDTLSRLAGIAKNLYI